MARSSSHGSHRFEIHPSSLEGAIVGVVTRPQDAANPGTWVLYLHGFGSSQAGDKAEFFRARCVELGVPFVSFDFQGHGESGGSVRDLTVARCLRDVQRVRQYAEGLFETPPVLMGSSMGGLVGLWHATTSKAVAGAFVAPALGLDESFPALIGSEGMERWEESGILPITNELGTFDLGWEFVEDLRSRRLEDLQQRHRLPTIIFQGQQDDRVSWQRVKKFADAVPETTRLVLFPDGGHRLIEKRHEIWTAIVQFAAGAGLVEDETRWQPES